MVIKQHLVTLLQVQLQADPNQQNASTRLQEATPLSSTIFNGASLSIIGK